MPQKLIDIAGQRFGRLLVGKYVGNRLWACECDCGNTVEVAGGSLRRGATQSCGCLSSEVTSERNRKHPPIKHGDSRSAIYFIWQAMKDRCANSNNPSYERYGGRGIAVCARWRDSYADFAADMGPRPKGMTLERKDVNGNYEPGNCVWASTTDQANNKRNSVFIEVNGQRMTVGQASKAYGIHYDTLVYRLKAGWPIERALA